MAGNSLAGPVAVGELGDSSPDVLHSAVIAALRLPPEERDVAVPAAVETMLGQSAQREEEAQSLLRVLEAARPRLPADAAPFLEMLATALLQAAAAPAQSVEFSPPERGAPPSGKAERESKEALLQLGDQVRIVVENDSECPLPKRCGTAGMVGKITLDDGSDVPFRILFPNGDELWYKRDWVKLDEAVIGKADADAAEAEESDERPFSLGPTALPLAVLLNIANGLEPDDLTPAAGACKSLCISININLQYMYFLVRLIRLIVLGPEIARAMREQEESSSDTESTEAASDSAHDDQDGDITKSD